MQQIYYATCLCVAKRHWFLSIIHHTWQCDLLISWLTLFCYCMSTMTLPYCIGMHWNCQLTCIQYCCQTAWEELHTETPAQSPFHSDYGNLQWSVWNPCSAAHVKSFQILGCVIANSKASIRNRSSSCGNWSFPIASDTSMFILSYKSGLKLDPLHRLTAPSVCVYIPQGHCGYLGNMRAYPLGLTQAKTHIFAYSQGIHLEGNSSMCWQRAFRGGTRPK